MEDMHRENKKLALKLKVVTQTQVKDMQKRVKERENETSVLKEMLRSTQLQMRGKDNEI